jgi:hypothetical protein
MSLLPNTETTHNTYAACGAVPLSQHNTETQGTMTSHYFGQKGKIVNLFLEFIGLYHYQMREGRKPKYSEKTPDDLFIELYYS